MKLTVIQGDITTLVCDAIVNAANCELLPGGGVCGAIHCAAGPGLAAACSAIGWTPTGDVVTTCAFNLPCKIVLHAVGPMWIDGHTGEPAMLYAAYFRSLLIAKLNDCRTIAFPCISTGIYGYPPDAAVGVALMACADFARVHPGALDEVIFCCFSQEDAERYRTALGVSS